MKKIITTLFLIGAINAISQSLSFGVDVMPKKNSLTGNNSEVITKYEDPQFIVVDRTNDSLGFFFNKFTATNNIEIPIYLRFKTKKRWFFDVSYSLSKFTLEAGGKTAYVGNFYEKYYPKQNFLDSLDANGWTSSYYNQDSIYDLFIDKQKDFWTDEFNYIESCKIRSFGFLAGYRFMPHKAYKPYVQAGIVYRRKVSNYLFQNFAMENTWVNDVAVVSEGMVKLADNLVYFRMGAGVETYRFRAGINFDVASSGTPSSNYKANKRVVARQSTAPYNSIMSFGFYIGADLFSYDIASKKQSLESNNGISEIPKVKMQQDKWSLGLRLNNPVKYNLTGYYSSQIPLNLVSYHRVPKPNFGGQNLWDFYFSIMAIKDITLVDSKPQVEAFFRKNFFKKFSVEGYMGYNTLKVDFATTEARLKMTYLSPTDTIGEFYTSSNKDTKVYAGVFRKNWGVFNMGTNLTYEVVSKDLLKVRLNAGLNVNFLIDNAFETSEKENVNSSDLAYDFNTWMNGGASSTIDNLRSGDELYVGEGQLAMDVYGTPDDFFQSFDAAELKNVTNSKYLQYYTASELYQHKQTVKTYFGSFRLGAEAEFNRFLIGVNYEANLGYMQGLLLKNYSNLSLSFGYLVFKK